MQKSIERCPTCGRLRTQESSRPCRCKAPKIEEKTTGIAGPHFIRWLLIIGISVALIYFGTLLSAMLFPKF